MRKKPTRNQYSKMPLSEIIFRKKITRAEIEAQKPAATSFARHIPVEVEISFKIRSDGALLAFGGSPLSVVHGNDNVFKFKTGLRPAFMNNFRWASKRTPMGLIMGIVYSNRYDYGQNKREFIEIFNELEVKLLRAKRDSMRAKLNAEKGKHG